MLYIVYKEAVVGKNNFLLHYCENVEESEIRVDWNYKYISVSIRAILGTMGARFNLLKFTCVVTLVDLLITGIHSTICTDRAALDGFTNVLPMCRSGTLTAGRVLVDTYDTGGLGHISCQCSVRLTVTHTVPVHFDVSAYPDTAPVSDCRSKLRFTRLRFNTFAEYICQQISGDVINNFTINEVYNIMLTRSDDNIPWQSGYCIFFKTDVDINVTCEAPSPGLRTTKAAATTTTTTTTAQPLKTTSTPPTVSPALPPADVICGCCKCNDPAFPLAAVIVPIVVSVLVVALGTAVNIILYRRLSVPLQNLDGVPIFHTRKRSSVDSGYNPYTSHCHNFDMTFRGDNPRRIAIVYLVYIQSRKRRTLK
ncbi:uncharacterized protein LOC117328384 [Pecten maximus]|uniref:uncharacterized protein LOC117328384 n=1 Tax=Pecten maximus TaxID=6579 RepID=UPI0014582B40|nr:uncharacterized protein LOC117328384 [Pecten maximus]